MDRRLAWLILTGAIAGCAGAAEGIGPDLRSGGDEFDLSVEVDLEPPADLTVPVDFEAPLDLAPVDLTPMCSYDAGGRDCNGKCITSTQCCTNTDCPTPANGAPLCTNNACGVTCNGGYKACNGQCIPNA